MPTVSVIIPTYNQSAYLPACIGSVLAQTFRDFELIVVDDGSTDNTPDTLAPWVRQGKIQYIRQENQGQAAASNEGLRRATGEFIALLDSDDQWLPDKLEWQVEYLRRHPDAGVVGGGHQFIDQTGATTRPPYLREGVVSPDDAFNGSPFISIGETMIRSPLLKDLGGFDETIWMAQDYDFFLKIIRNTRVVRVPRLCLYYRTHGANNSQTVLRTYMNAERVLRRHLKWVPPRHRARIACQAYQWLYDYRGERVIMAGKAMVSRGEFSDSFRVAMIVLRLLAAAMHDRAFLRQVFRDAFIPVRFHTPKPAHASR